MIALGMPLRGAVDPLVLVQWLTVLRSEAWLGPVYWRRDVYPARARNEICDEFLAGPADALFLFDSDQLPPYVCQDAGGYRSMMSILEEEKEAVVCGLVYRRQPPYDPVAYTLEKGKRRYLTPGRMTNLLAQRGLTEIDSYGSGSILIQRRALQHIKDAKAPRPIWEHDPRFEEDEGWKFFDDLRGLGYRIWLDTRIEAAHLETRAITSVEYMREHNYELSPA